MLFNIATVGFSKLEDSNKRFTVINDVINNYTKMEYYDTDTEKKYVENKKQYGKNIGIIVRGLQQNDKMTVTNIVPYAETAKKINVKDVRIERAELELLAKPVVENEYHVTITDILTNMKITFYLQNVIDYLKNNQRVRSTFNQVSISALAYSGKIVLPIASEEEEYEEMSGEYCSADDEVVDRILKEGTILEDMEQYFIQSQKIDAIYHILGKIIDVKKTNNIETKEKIYLLEVDVMGMSLEVYVNEKELVGMPIKGMRFMGTCWLQGSIQF